MKTLKHKKKSHNTQFFLQQENYYDKGQTYAYKRLGGLDELHTAYEDGDIDGADVICTIKVLNQYKIKETIPRYVLRKIS